MSLTHTAMVGIAGSWGAGVLVALLTGGRYTAGFVASFAGSFLIVYLIRRHRGGSLTHPGNVGRRF
jgi:uncharacterized membrane protein YeaQ/YmgE (transglycosylase-associated protein family)